MESDFLAIRGLVHQMRTRIITSPAFTGERILGAILFENTMYRQVAAQPTADYLWNVKRIVPFLKVDRGLQPEKDGVQLLNPMPPGARPPGAMAAFRTLGASLAPDKPKAGRRFCHRDAVFARDFARAMHDPDGGPTLGIRR